MIKFNGVFSFKFRHDERAKAAVIAQSEAQFPESNTAGTNEVQSSGSVVTLDWLNAHESIEWKWRHTSKETTAKENYGCSTALF